MSLYGLDEEILVMASDAVQGRTYRCTCCDGPVRVRRGRDRLPHFYHLKMAPSCRLYSKSEDHLCAQLALQELFPKGEIALEKPFLDILRVADVVWEARRIVFEIQCSLIEPYEVEFRIHQYRETGYEIVWLLDDRLFNRPYKLRQAEQELRRTACYYITLRRIPAPRVYDQFEVYYRQQRLKRSGRATVHLGEPRRLSELVWNANDFPDQVLQRAQVGRLYFRGDLIHKALLAAAIPALAFSMRQFRALETLFLASAKKLASPVRRWWRRHVLGRFVRLLDYLEAQIS